MNGQMSAFVAPDEYKKSRIEQLLDDEQRLSLAIALGKGAVELVSSRPGKDFRILCNLMSGGTNPYVIQELRGLARSDGRIQIHQCNQLHAKVVVGSCQALIGSRERINERPGIRPPRRSSLARSRCTHIG